jgi:RNA polymerase sigma factor (sigma-70 family)
VSRMADSGDIGSRVTNNVAETAFRRHYRDVLRFVRGRADSRDDPEDITQTVFMQAVEQLEASKMHSDGVLPWLFTVAQRRLIDAARTRSRRGTAISLDEFPDALASDATYDPSVARAIQRAIAELPDHKRRVVVMRLLEGRTFAEIARRTESSEATCRAIFSRSLSDVQDHLVSEGVKP